MITLQEAKKEISKLKKEVKLLQENINILMWRDRVFKVVDNTTTTMEEKAEGLISLGFRLEKVSEVTDLDLSVLRKIKRNLTSRKKESESTRQDS